MHSSKILFRYHFIRNYTNTANIYLIAVDPPDPRNHIGSGSRLPEIDISYTCFNTVKKYKKSGLFLWKVITVNFSFPEIITHIH